MVAALTAVSSRQNNDPKMAVILGRNLGTTFPSSDSSFDNSPRIPRIPSEPSLYHLPPGFEQRGGGSAGFSTFWGTWGSWVNPEQYPQIRVLRVYAGGPQDEPHPGDLGEWPQVRSLLL